MKNEKRLICVLSFLFKNHSFYFDLKSKPFKNVNFWSNCEPIDLYGLCIEGDMYSVTFDFLACN